MPIMSQAYDAYFRSGLYQARYPRPNPAILRLVRSVVPDAGAVLDFGCGTGRYLPDLLARPGVTATGYDISPEAIATCRERFAAAVAGGRLRLVLGDLAALTAVVPPASLDAALLLFGVFGHIRGHAERIATLKVLHGLLRPGGRLLITVPNRRRRFLAEQAACAALVRDGTLEAGDILYHRTMGSGRLGLYYHLFTLPEFRGELRAAGFAAPRVLAESVLPERASIAGRFGALLDTALRAVAPLPLAYGFAAVAERLPHG